MASSRTPLQSSAFWQALTMEWLWVYQGDVPVVETWSAEIPVPSGYFRVEKGLVKIAADGREIVIRKGQSFLSAPGMRRQWFAAGTRLLSVGFRSLGADGSPVFASGLNVVLKTAQARNLEQSTRSLYASVHGGQTSVTYKQAIVDSPRCLADWCRREAAFYEWFSSYVKTLEQQQIKATKSGSIEDRQLSEWLQALNDWPLDQPFKLAQLSADSKLSTRRMHDLLQRHLGMTAQAWIERRRLTTARQRLTTEDTALKAIAFSLGFRHPPHFTAWFKRHMQMTPTRYRSAQGFEAA